MAPNWSEPTKILTSESYPKQVIVFIDLETTGLEPTHDEIIQIAAKCGWHCFNRYIIPERGIPPRITELTGISMVGDQMLLMYAPVTGVSKKTGLLDFIHVAERTFRFIVFHTRK